MASTSMHALALDEFINDSSIGGELSYLSTGEGGFGTLAVPAIHFFGEPDAHAGITLGLELGEGVALNAAGCVGALPVDMQTHILGCVRWSSNHWVGVDASAGFALLALLGGS